MLYHIYLSYEASYKHPIFCGRTYSYTLHREKVNISEENPVDETHRISL